VGVVFLRLTLVNTIIDGFFEFIFQLSASFRSLFFQKHFESGSVNYFEYGEKCLIWRVKMHFLFSPIYSIQRLLTSVDTLPIIHTYIH